MALSDHNINVSGRNVHYYEAGDPENPTVLLLHGGFGDSWMHWAEIMPGMADVFHLIAPDLPGYGQSTALQQTTISALVRWTSDLMDALEHSDVIIVGNSFGGLIARLLVAEQPQRVRALVLVNGGVIPNVPGFARFVAQTPVLGSFVFGRISKSTTARGNLTSVIEDQSLITDELVLRIRNNQGALARLMRGLSSSDVPEKRTPPVPVLLIWGEEDSITPRVVGEYIHKHIPGSKFSLIASCRHMPHLEVPDVFTWQIKNFIRELDRPDKSAKKSQ